MLTIIGTLERERESFTRALRGKISYGASPSYDRLSLFAERGSLCTHPASCHTDDFGRKWDGCANTVDVLGLDSDWV